MVVIYVFIITRFVNDEQIIPRHFLVDSFTIKCKSSCKQLNTRYKDFC